MPSHVSSLSWPKSSKPTHLYNISFLHVTCFFSISKRHTCWHTHTQSHNVSFLPFGQSRILRWHLLTCTLSPLRPRPHTTSAVKCVSLQICLPLLYLTWHTQKLTLLSAVSPPESMLLKPDFLSHITLYHIAFCQKVIHAYQAYLI